MDLLRGLAIAFVVMNHVNMRLRSVDPHYASALPDPLVSFFVWNGQRGVQMFFALSGFLIMSMTLRRWRTLPQVSMRDFYALRFARIAPLLTALIAVLCALHAWGLRWFTVSAKTGGLWRAVAAAATFHVNVLEARRGYLPANWDILWSLSVEEVFYLAFPILCILLGRQTRFFTLVLFTFVVLGPFARTIWSEGNPVWREYSYLGGMDAIAMGCLTALWLRGRELRRETVRGMAGGGVALLIWAFCGSSFTGRIEMERAGLDMTFIGIGTCLVAAASAASNWQVKGVLNPLLVVGRRSYEIYLTHMFVVFGGFALFLLLPKQPLLIPVFFAAALVLGGVVGWAVGVMFSEPANKWLRHQFAETKHGVDQVMIEASKT